MFRPLRSFFGVTTDYLLDSQSDEREVGELINELKNRLLCADGLMFNGEALTESELKQLSDAIEISAAVVLSQKERKNDEQKSRLWQREFIRNTARPILFAVR